jgi:hypothetical protein
VPSAMTTVFGSATPCRRAARFGVSLKLEQIAEDPASDRPALRQVAKANVSKSKPFGGMTNQRVTHLPLLWIMATRYNYTARNTSLLIGVKYASPGIPDPYFTTLLLFGALGLREKCRQGATIPLCHNLHANSKPRTKAPPKFSSSCDPLCFLSGQ